MLLGLEFKFSVHKLKPLFNHFPHCREIFADCLKGITLQGFNIGPLVNPGPVKLMIGLLDDLELIKCLQINQGIDFLGLLRLLEILYRRQ